MKLYLATSNKGKVREIQALLHHHEVIPAFGNVIEPFEVVEDAPTFAGNAKLKSEAVFRAIHDNDAIVIADDSGISVEVLDNAPGIYSARYAGEDATDKDNLAKLVEALKAKGVERSKAYYTAAIAVTTRDATYVVHGWMHGYVTIHPKGDKGFGYDPMFIPFGYEQTLGELPDSIKQTLSHRGQALQHLQKLLKVILS